MIQLNVIASEFLKLKFDYLAVDNRIDDVMLIALNDSSMDIEKRKTSVAHWLHRYAVLRIRGVSGMRIAENILAFADTGRLAPTRLTPEQIKSEFHRLEPALRVGTHSLSEGNPLRVIDSLASKALWCLYPDSVPILDKYAECSLMVLTRLCRSSVAPGQDRYGIFVDSWFTIYDQLKDVLPLVNRDIYRYDVRFMDRFLWWLGIPAFETFESSTAPLEHSPPALRIAEETEDL